MSDSSAEDDAHPGRGKVVQRHKRELKELREQQRREVSKLPSFAKAKRDHEKVKLCTEKRDIEEKYRLLEEELRCRHAEELAAVDGAEGAATGAVPADLLWPLPDALLALDVSNEGTRKAKLQRKRDRLAEIEKEVREEGCVGPAGAMPQAVAAN
mmetsp:Transcript_86054/g.238411  ORF Transcript_86054/g.238411 Transcript_86054/m.238411 type:complete len:155 (-) Transcript_86054:106-570(-)